MSFIVHKLSFILNISLILEFDFFFLVLVTLLSYTDTEYDKNNSLRF